ncbi:MAG: methionyl-tRNA formyltransferase, partial [Acidobacteriota bacterium]|nr:methionyl-tRNA formyltransferase [Acidobacteriota bacterium]
MKIVFCGTPQFAVPTLERLIQEKFETALVVTNPDEPSGRGHETKPPPVKETALKAGLSIFQPVRFKGPETETRITPLKPDVVVVVAFGHIIPQWMIALPPLGCLNLHASLLPRYRGAAPIAWSIIRGERTTGNTTMKIDAGLDTGDILLQQETGIAADDTAATLGAKLSVLGAELMIETLRGLEAGVIQPRPQDHSLATLAPLLKKEDGIIDWTLRPEDIERRVRGLQPWPLAHTVFRKRGLAIWAARPTDSPGALQPGELAVKNRKLFAGCGEG